MSNPKETKQQPTSTSAQDAQKEAFYNALTQQYKADGQVSFIEQHVLYNIQRAMDGAGELTVTQAVNVAISTLTPLKNYQAAMKKDVSNSTEAMDRAFHTAAKAFDTAVGAVEKNDRNDLWKHAVTTSHTMPLTKALSAVVDKMGTEWNAMGARGTYFDTHELYTKSRQAQYGAEDKKAQADAWHDAALEEIQVPAIRKLAEQAGLKDKGNKR